MTVFRDALRTFKASLSVEELEEFELVTLRDLKLQLRAIQNRQETEKRLRNMRRLDYFLEAMESHGKSIQAFLNTSDILCFVWGPMSFILQVANNYAEAFHSLLDIYHDIGENLPLLSQYQTLFKENLHMIHILEHMFTTIFDFHLEALKYFKQPSWKKIFAHTCKSFRSRFSPIIDQLRRYKTLLEKQASLAQFVEFQAANANVIAEFKKIREDEQRRRYVDVQRWLAAADTRADHNIIASVREDYVNSGQWVLDSDQFQTWADPTFCGAARQAMLWINGIPGAGKTVIGSRIIDRLTSDPAFTAIYFYCRHGDEQRDTFLAVAAGLLAQIIRLNANILDCLYEKVYAKGAMTLSLDEAKDVLEVGVKSFPRTAIIIDGLDECGEKEERKITVWFRDLIEKLPKGLEGSLRCIFLSQETKVASKRLGDLPRLPLRSEGHNHDIAMFIERMSERVQQRYKIDNYERQTLTDSVKMYSDGMFLYAKLVLENLLVQPNREKLLDESRLGRLPRGITDAYARVFDTVFSQPTEQQARQLLAFLVCAKRQLKWFEIQGAVSINLDNRSVSFDSRCWVDGPKDICGSLLNIRTDGGLELVHSTARFYILDQQIIKPLLEEYELACLCVGYLGCIGFNGSGSDDFVEKRVSNGYYAFMDYAVSNWSRHLQSALPTLQEHERRRRLEGLLETFLDTHYGAIRPNSIPSSIEHVVLDPFKEFKRFEQLVSAYDSTLKQLRFFGDRSDEYNNLEVTKTVLRIRASLEKKVLSVESSEDQISKLERYYGKDMFKCPRISCRYFHAGFTSKEKRDKHVHQHELPFICTYKGCLNSDLGFSSEQELRRHLRQLHKESIQRKPTYPSNRDLYSQQNSEHVCSICLRKFKQKYNFDGHMRQHQAEEKVLPTQAQLEVIVHEYEQLHAQAKRATQATRVRVFAKPTQAEIKAIVHGNAQLQAQARKAIKATQARTIAQAQTAQAARSFD